MMWERREDGCCSKRRKSLSRTRRDRHSLDSRERWRKLNEGEMVLGGAVYKEYAINIVRVWKGEVGCSPHMGLPLDALAPRLLDADAASGSSSVLLSDRMHPFGLFPQSSTNNVCVRPHAAIPNSGPSGLTRRPYRLSRYSGSTQSMDGRAIYSVLRVVLQDFGNKYMKFDSPIHILLIVPY
ncbi:hypothetical protein BKA93DRAFT_796870 [Sparassis latifolia]